MKVGLLGPSAWSQRIDEFSESVDVIWGTDDPARVTALLRECERVDAVAIEGSVEFVTSTIVATLAAVRVRVFVLVFPPEVSHWTDSVEGITRVSALSEIRIAITPTVDASSLGDDIFSAIAIEPTQSDNAPEPRRGRVVAVWGPVGAPGVTSVSIGLAALAVRSGYNVILCDADSRGASIAIGLGLIDDVPGFAAACRLAGRDEFTHAEYKRLAMVPSQFEGRLAVLTGLPRASRWSETSAPKSRKVVMELRQWADFVIVDAGFGIEENEWIDGAPQRDGGARAIVADADVVVAVGRGDAVGISRLIRGLDELKDMCAQPLVVVNHVTRQSAREAKDAIERFSDSKVEATISADSRSGIEDAATRASASLKELWVGVIRRLTEVSDARER